MTIQDFVRDCSLSMFRDLGVKIHKLPGCYYGASKVPDPLLNFVYPNSLKESQITSTTEKTAQYFKELQLPYSWWSETSTEPPQLREVLMSKGLKDLGEFPGMFLNAQDVKEPTHPEELVVERVVDRETLALWSDILCKANHFSDECSRSYSALFENAGFEGPFHHLVGKVNDIIVATGTLLCTKQGGYIYNVSTSENARGKGYGAELSYQLTKLAQSQSLSQIALVSSSQAISVYSKLGFQKVNRYRIYA